MYIHPVIFGNKKKYFIPFYDTSDMAQWYEFFVSPASATDQSGPQRGCEQSWSHEWACGIWISEKKPRGQDKLMFNFK